MVRPARAGKRAIERPRKKRVVDVVAEGLMQYALVYREPSTLPAAISAETIRAYAYFLRGCEPERLETAMWKCGAEAGRCRFFPTPEAIRRAYDELGGAASAILPVCTACGGSGAKNEHGLAIGCSVCSGSGRERG